MKVYVVYDRLYERVISVHKTEAGANAKAEKLEAKRSGRLGYDFEYGEYELET